MENNKNTTKNIEVQIPKEGSLGILALGAVGVEKWRLIRDQQKNRSVE